MPFFSLKPKEVCLRSEFSTTYSLSTAERKENIRLAALSIDKTLVDVGGEFSFNLTVGERTENRGYKNAKIIVNGEFIDGVGGGVCQVSTTLYNAVLLAGLKISEYHPHSLSVGYVSPSFDAMVNSGSADLKFINNTDNPILIFCSTDNDKLSIKIFGQPMSEKIILKSVITDIVYPPNDLIITDENGDYPDLYEDEFERVKNAKSGLVSEGYILTVKNNEILNSKKIRSDVYKSVQGVLIQGKKQRYPSAENLPIES